MGKKAKLITNLPAVIERDAIAVRADAWTAEWRNMRGWDAIDQHFDSANDFLDRKRNPGTRTVRRGAKAFSVTSRRGHTLWAVACAEFHGGENIRMTFSHLIGKPWNFAAARRLLAQAVGNERARGGAVIASAERTKAFEAAQVMAERGATEGERAAGARAVKRLTKKKRAAKKIMENLAAKIENLARYNGHPLATDFRDFYIELDGSRIDATALPEKPLRARLTRKAEVPVPPPAPEPVCAPTPAASDAVAPFEELLETLNAQYGKAFMVVFRAGVEELAANPAKLRAYRTGSHPFLRIQFFQSAGQGTQRRELDTFQREAA